MAFWHIFMIIAFLFIIIEAFIPLLVFSCITFASCVTALISIFIGNGVSLTITLVILTFIFHLLMRQFTLGNIKPKRKE